MLRLLSLHVTRSPAFCMWDSRLVLLFVIGTIDLSLYFCFDLVPVWLKGTGGNMSCLHTYTCSGVASNIVCLVLLIAKPTDTCQGPHGLLLSNSFFFQFKRADNILTPLAYTLGNPIGLWIIGSGGFSMHTLVLYHLLGDVV